MRSEGLRVTEYVHVQCEYDQHLFFHCMHENMQNKACPDSMMWDKFDAEEHSSG